MEVVEAVEVAGMVVDSLVSDMEDTLVGGVMVASGSLDMDSGVSLVMA